MPDSLLNSLCTKQGLAVTQTRPAVPKMLRGPVGIPLFGAPLAPGDKHNASKEGLSLGGRPLRPAVYPVMRHTRPNRAARYTAGQSTYHQLEKCALIIKKKKKKKTRQGAGHASQLFSVRHLYRLSSTHTN